MPVQQRKTSSMSTSSDDSMRKISNDSGISIGAAPRSLPQSLGVPGRFEDLIGEPRLSTDLSAAMLQLAQQQQSLSAAAALNPAMLGLMSAGLGGLWANPLATAMLQQETTARKLLESASGKGSSLGSAKQHYPKEPFPLYHPGLAGLMQHHQSSQVADQLALTEALRGQLLSRKLSEDISGGAGAVRPTRKANSFSGTCSSPFNKQFSPPTSNTASPNHNSLSPYRNGAVNGVDELQPSSYGDDDSICSGKSSTRSRTPQPMSQLDNQSMYNSATTENLPTTVLNQHQFHPSSRKRKNGIVGSMQLPDLGAYAPGSHPAFPSQGANEHIPLHKLSTASLPASLPSATHRRSLVHEPLSARGSPATSKKRRAIQIEENVGQCREDESYWERRRKNNEAAKRSRDSRRAKEDEIAIRAAFLEQENLRLRVELNKMKDEFAKLQTELDSYKVPDDEVTADDSGDSGAAADDPLSVEDTPPSADSLSSSPTTTSPTAASNS